MASVSREAVRQLEVLPYLEVLQVPAITEFITVSKAKPALSPWQKWGYALMFCALAFCVIQAVRCTVVSSLKLGAVLHQLTAIKLAHTETIEKNVWLKEKISLYRSPQGLEELARERLGLVKADEVLVRVYPVALAQKSKS